MNFWRLHLLFLQHWMHCALVWMHSPGLAVCQANSLTKKVSQPEHPQAGDVPLQPGPPQSLCHTEGSPFLPKCLCPHSTTSKWDLQAQLSPWGCSQPATRSPHVQSALAHTFPLINVNVWASYHHKNTLSALVFTLWGPARPYSHCHSSGKEASGQWSQFPSSHPQAASPWSIRSKASAEAFATFPPSATHFPLGRKCSPRRPGRCLSRSRQKFSLARNKTAFAAWGPAPPSTAKDSTILPCSWEPLLCLNRWVNQVLFYSCSLVLTENCIQLQSLLP